MLNFKNPFLYIALTLAVIFFIPMHSAYNLLKLIIAILVISYAISLAVFGRDSKDENQKYSKKNMEELEAALDRMEND